MDNVKPDWLVDVAVGVARSDCRDKVAAGWSVGVVGVAMLGELPITDNVAADCWVGAAAAGVVVPNKDTVISDWLVGVVGVAVSVCPPPIIDKVNPAPSVGVAELGCTPNIDKVGPCWLVLETEGMVVSGRVPNMDKVNSGWSVVGEGVAVLVVTPCIV
ncbi:hypothetical protein ACOMHN_022094 [Nucella lapillus]